MLSFYTFYTFTHWLPNQWVPSSKPLSGSKVNSVFHPSKVDEVSNRNFWELIGKKINCK